MASTFRVAFVLNGTVRVEDTISSSHVVALMSELHSELRLQGEGPTSMEDHIYVRRRLLDAYDSGDRDFMGITVPVVFWLFMNHPGDNFALRKGILSLIAEGDFLLLADCVDKGGRAFWGFSVLTRDELASKGFVKRSRRRLSEAAGTVPSRQ